MPPECRFCAAWRDGAAFDPLELQWILPLQGPQASRQRFISLVRVRRRSWFEIALAAEASPETVDEAVEAYQRVIEISPEWVEAHINLGVALYHQRRLDDAQNAFLRLLLSILRMRFAGTIWAAFMKRLERLMRPLRI